MTVIKMSKGEGGAATICSAPAAQDCRSAPHRSAQTAIVE
jgi:hypothetical protein